MKAALEDAGMFPGDIGYINGHLTATPPGDSGEAKAMARLFGDAAEKVSVSGTKSMTGHMLGAAGAAEAAICIFALRENAVPPTINTVTPDPALPGGLDYVIGKTRKREVKAALSNTFGFGGHNASLIIKRHI